MSNPLKNYSDEDLKEELERRKHERENPLPRPKCDPYQCGCFKNLAEYLIEGVHTLNKEGYAPKDFEHYVFETAMTCFYGEGIWKWWNSKL